MNYCSRWSEIEVLNTLSDVALKILSLYSLTESLFQYSEGLFKSIQLISRSGKIKIGSKAE